MKIRPQFPSGAVDTDDQSRCTLTERLRINRRQPRGRPPPLRFNDLTRTADLKHATADGQRYNPVLTRKAAYVGQFRGSLPDLIEIGAEQRRGVPRTRR